MNNFKVVSYYTENTVYKDIANEYLIPSLQKTKLEWEVDAVANKKDWYKNTAYKPSYIYMKLCNTDKDIVWVDCDARIVVEPSALSTFPLEYDIALHYLDWSRHYKRPKDTTKELLTGTLYLRNSLKVKQLVNKWAIESMNNTGIWEQKILERLLKARDIKVFELPEEYCCIVDQKGKIPTYIHDPVIIHYQASRSVKKHSI